MAYNKGFHSSNGGNNRGRPYVLILLITFGVALLGVMVLHKLRERRIYNLVVKEKDHQLLALQLFLQKERDRTKELRGKNEEMKAKIYALRSQKMELARTVAEMQSTMDSLKDEQKVMESAFEEKQNELRMMQEKGSNLGQGSSEIIALRENLKQKEAEIKDLKHRLEILLKNHQVSINDHPTIFSEIVTANGTMASQDETENDNKEKDGNSSESAKYGGDDDKGITNEDASESKLTKFKDGEVTAEIKDEIQTDEELGKKFEDPQDDGGADVTAKDIEAVVMDGREKKAIREEKPIAKFDGRGQDFNGKQLAGVKRKHGHVSRTKGKRWRAIVKNRLMENNGIFESHDETNMGNRKAYRDEKDELKDRIVGRVSAKENFAREDKRRDNNNPRKDKPEAKLLKPENHENKEDAKNMTVNNINHQVTNNGINTHPEKQRLDEIIQTEEDEDSHVQQNWSRRHINKADKNAGQTKSNMFHEESEEFEVSDVRKKEKDAIDDGDEDKDTDDDFVKESHSAFEDEKEEYNEEIE
ncbi:uncharacterized protein LOC133303151 [Gastrolobium bilobum]|uniref:uncharacterized protein LOC133303151 n=1 Tax=Gastrolobium bilobum TaxID=150636 RepID=UPI002AB0333E|nr:uncharacterized protein LOC133303151 [Gastrolobium bilobum]